MGRLVLITGVSQGLGRVMVDRLIAKGHTIIGCSRNASEIQLLSEQYLQPHSFTVVDVSSDESVEAWAEKVVRQYQEPVDLLINSAGIVTPLQYLWETDTSTFDQVIDVNVKGVANVIRHFVPPMVKQCKGTIINFSAGWGRYTAPQAAPYCASKWAIEGLTKALSQELPEGMAAATLWPGSIHTESLETIYGLDKAKRYPSPTEWAELAIPFLLSIGPSDNGKALTLPTG